MQSISLSPYRIIRTAIILSVSLAALLSVVYLYRPIKDLLQNFTEPVTVQPKIYGSVIFYGKPAAGVELRIGGKSGNKWPSCAELPVVAVSDASGRFRVPAKTTPHFLVGHAKLIPTVVCVMQGSRQLASWLAFRIPGNTLPDVIHCRLPLMGPVGPENDTCYITAP
jgi:hypothetical protein